MRFVIDVAWGMVKALAVWPIACAALLCSMAERVWRDARQDAHMRALDA